MAEQQEKAKAEPTKVASGKVVKYVGTADVREIDAAAWRNAGVEDQNKVVWSAKNGFQVSASDLNDGALKYVDTNDDGFVVVDADVKS